MKLPPYPLQVVLEQREREKDKAQKRLEDAKKAVKREKEKAEQLREEKKAIEKKKDAAVNEFQQRISGGGVAMNIQAEAERLTHFEKRMEAEIVQQDQKIKAQDQEVKRAERAVQDAVFELNKASMNLEAMEKHKERWTKEKKAEIEAIQELEADEIGQVMWVARQRKESLRAEGAAGGDGGGDGAGGGGGGGS